MSWDHNSTTDEQTSFSATPWETSVNNNIQSQLFLDEVDNTQ